MKAPEEIEERLKKVSESYGDTHAYFMTALALWFVGACILRAADIISDSIDRKRV